MNRQQQTAAKGFLFAFAGLLAAIIICILTSCASSAKYPRPYNPSTKIHNIGHHGWHWALGTDRMSAN